MCKISQCFDLKIDFHHSKAEHHSRTIPSKTFNFIFQLNEKMSELVANHQMQLADYQKQVETLQKAENELTKQIEEQKAKNNVSFQVLTQDAPSHVQLNIFRFLFDSFWEFLKLKSFWFTRKSILRCSTVQKSSQNIQISLSPFPHKKTFELWWWFI